MDRSAAWFALQSRPKCEWKALEVLTAKGYECFLPMYRRQKSQSHGTVCKEVPLFPSYLFCRFDPRATNGLSRVVSTQYVWRIVSFGGRPMAMLDHEAEAVLKAVQANVPREPWDYIPTGARVRIAKGALAGIEGIRLPNSKRGAVLLSVSLLQRSVLVTVEQDAVFPVITGDEVSPGTLSVASNQEGVSHNSVAPLSSQSDTCVA